MKFIKKYKEIIIYSILLMIYGVFILLRSPLSPGSKMLMGTDCSVFIYIGQSMEKGLIPYRDMFDHKGIVLYFINFIGNHLFNGTIGVWLIEVLFIWIDFIIVWKLVKLFTKSNMISFFTVLISFLPLMQYFYYGNGNKTEEFALPFIFIIVYECIKYLQQRPEKLQKKMWLINGIASAIILWLQPNLAIVDVIFVGAIGIYMLYRKEFKVLIQSIVWFCIGVSIVTLPIVIYLVANNALKHCFNSYIIFNFKYTEAGGTSSILEILIKNWSRTILSSISLIVCVWGLLKTNKKDNEFLILIVSIIFLLSSYLIFAIAGRNLPYYGIICIPAFIYPTYYALNYILKDKKQDIITFALTLIVILVAFCGDTSKLINCVIEAHTKDVEKYDDEIIAQYIQERTDEDDEVIALGTRTRINLLSGRRTSAKYFYQLPIADIDENIAKQFLKWLKKTEPQIMVCYIEKPTKKEDETYFTKQLYKYLNKMVKQEKYTANKNLVRNVTIYEKVN